MSQYHSVIRSWLSRELKAAGAQVLAVHGHSMQAPGWPDLRVSHRLFRGWVEVKWDADRPSPIQCRLAEALCAAGDPAVFAWVPTRSGPSGNTVLFMVADASEPDRWRAIFHSRLMVDRDRGSEILRALAKVADITGYGREPFTSPCPDGV